MPDRKQPMKRSRIKPKQREMDDPDTVAMMEWRFEVFFRAESKCQAQCTPTCGRWAQHAHHIEGRVGTNPETGVELRFDPDNGLALCHDCHAWIHDHSTESYEQGWMRKRIH
jgi:hypothetical protein